MWRTVYLVVLGLLVVVIPVSTSYAVVVGSGAFSPSPIAINFDNLIGGTSFDSGTVVTNQYASIGATFVNPDFQNYATMIFVPSEPGASLPNSLSIIQHDQISSGNQLGRPLQIIFATPMLRVGMIFGTSTNSTITMSAFSLDGTLLESSTISGARLFGFIGLQEAGGIGHVELYSRSTIRPNSQNFNFDIDNVTFDPVPEPSSLALLALGAIGLFARRRIAHSG
jgi:hypothetical protein